MQLQSLEDTHVALHALLDKASKASNCSGMSKGYNCHSVIFFFREFSGSMEQLKRYNSFTSQN